MTEPALTDHERLYVPMVQAAFNALGLDPTIGCGIAYVESQWNPEAKSKPGASDDKLGGAWGLFQITWATACILGFKGKPDQLFNPSLNAQLAAKLMVHNRDMLEKARLTTTPERLIAAHNCGVQHVIHNTIPESTAHDYVPAVLKATPRYTPHCASANSELA